MGEKSGEFQMKKRIKQGDSFSPLLFNIIVDRIKKNRKKNESLQIFIGYRNLVPIRIKGLLYADNIVLMADTAVKIQKYKNF